MSFSSDVKTELAEHITNAIHCRKAELCGMLRAGGKITDSSKGKPSISFSSENEEITKKCFTFLGKSYNISLVPPEAVKDGRRRTEYEIRITDEKLSEEIIRDLGLTKAYEKQLGTVLKRPCCKRAYVRGAFLVNGTMNDPAKSYHLEIKASDDEEAKRLMEFIGEWTKEPKVTYRKGQPAVYMKDGTQVGDMLALMEAAGSMLKFEEQRVVRETRGIVNRRVNCEFGNLAKTTNASRKQIEEIEYIRDTVGLESLPENLQEIARLRLEQPDASLAELGELLHPTMGRSGVNHRLQKLMGIAEEIRTR